MDIDRKEKSTKVEAMEEYLLVGKAANTESLIGVCWVGYSRDIRGIFGEYSRDIRMYRVCVGYVSGMYREIDGG